MRSRVFTWLTIAAIVLVVGMVIGQQAKRSGNHFYASSITWGTADSTANGTQTTLYDDNKFYFNSLNSKSAAVVYWGYSHLTAYISMTGATTSADSIYFVGWMLDYNGNRTPSTDSLVIAGPITMTEGDTIVYRLDNISGYHTQWGIQIRAKKCLTNADHAGYAGGNVYIAVDFL